MAVSGVSNFNPAAVQIITGAFRKMGVINEDEVPTAGQFADGLLSLNAVTKEFEATGIHVWTEEEGIIFLQQNQRTYRLGGATTDRACDANAWTFTTLAANATQGATSVLVTSASGLLSGDNFGAVLNTGASFWTKIAGISGATINLAAPLPAAASAQACVFDYPVSAQLTRPLRVPFTRRLQFSQPGTPQAVQAPDWGGIITPLAPMCSRQEYFNLPQPNNPGLVTQAYYNPARDQGEMWVWNVSQNANYGLRFTYYRPINDWTTPATTADFPQEWSNTLIWTTAEELLLNYSVPQIRAGIIIATAARKRELVEGWDREPESVYFGRASSQTRG